TGEALPPGPTPLRVGACLHEGSRLMEQKISPGVRGLTGPLTGSLSGPALLAQRAIKPIKPIMRPVMRGGPTLAKRWRAFRKSPVLRPFIRPLTALSFLGPGLIAANAGNDAGGITTYAAVGAQYGYGLLWMLIPITISMAV